MRPILLLCITRAVAAPCSGVGYEHAIMNLREKLGNPAGESSSGADWTKGSRGAAIYLYCDVENTEYESGNDFSAKVAMHEYEHATQQGYLTDTLTTLEPSADTLGDDLFIIKNYGSAPQIFETNVKNVLVAMPDDAKMVTVPTYVLLIPSTKGGIGPDNVDAAVSDIAPLLWGAECDGVDFDYPWERQVMTRPPFHRMIDAS